jgi:hypothetical protein
VRSPAPSSSGSRCFEEFPVARSLGPVGVVLGSFPRLGTDYVELFEDAGALKVRRASG